MDLLITIFALSWSLIYVNWWTLHMVKNVYTGGKTNPKYKAYLRHLRLSLLSFNLSFPQKIDISSVKVFRRLLSINFFSQFPNQAHASSKKGLLSNIWERIYFCWRKTRTYLRSNAPLLCLIYVNRSFK